MSGVEEGVAIAGLVVTAVSTAYAVDAQRKQGRYQGAIEEENRKQSLISAADAIHRGDAEEDAARRKTRLMIGAQQAAYAAAGVEVGAGSPLATTSDTAMFGELDALTIKSNAQREAWGYLAQSEDFRRRAGLVRQAARNQSGSTLLTGGSQALSQYGSALNSGAIKP